MLDKALEYAAKGWPVFPLTPRGKRPATSKGFKDATTDPDTIRYWWRRWPNANIGLHPGAAGLIVIDIDTGHDGAVTDDGFALLGRIMDEHPTMACLTGSGGYHLYYKKPEGVTFSNTSGDLPSGFDVRSDGGYVILPPSVHPNGNAYKWLTDDDIVTLPKFLTHLIKPQKKKRKTRDVVVPLGNVTDYVEGQMQALCSAVSSAPEGSRHEALKTAAVAAARIFLTGKVSADDVFNRVHDAAMRSGLPEDEVDGVIEWARLNAEDFEPWRIPPEAIISDDDINPFEDSEIKDTFGFNDYENAMAVLKHYENRMLYTVTHGWLWYEHGVWSRDIAEARVERAITNTLKWRVREALKSGSSGAIKYNAPNTNRVRGIKAMLQTLQATSISEFKQQTNLLNCKNGVIDLRTGELLPHNPDYKFMHQAPIAYDPNADRSVWLKFLGDVTPDEEIIYYLQRLVGYSLTGKTSEELMVYIYGPTRSGKGVFTETLSAIVGRELAKEVSFDILTHRKHADDQNFALAPLKEARLVFASESRERQRLDEAKLKRITGGNEVHCAFKHRDFFSYRPAYVVWMSSNFDVNADPDDDAVWGRLRLIPFPNSFLEKEDTKLKERLRTEAALQGVLAWAVQGAIHWNAMHVSGVNLSDLQRMKSKKQAIRSSLDVVGRWASEHLEEDEGADEPLSDVYQSYKAWCKENGHHALNVANLSKNLRKKGFKIERKRNELTQKPMRFVLNVTVTDPPTR